MTEGPSPLALAEEEPVAVAYVAGAHGDPAESYRQQALDHFWQAQERLAALVDVIRSRPDDDLTADACIRAFAVAQDHAGKALRRFRNVRECEGMA